MTSLRAIEKRNKTKKNSSKATNDDSVLMLSPFDNWNMFLTHAPSAIAILGELLLIGTSDFTLTEKMPAGGFRYIKYPDSFRASVVHVSNSSWKAFNEALTSMNQIRLMSGIIDPLIKDSVRILTAGSPTELKETLPSSLKRVEQISDDCLELAQNNEKTFTFIMLLTEELSEVITNTYGRKARDTSKHRLMVKLEQKKSEEVRNESKRKYGDIALFNKPDETIEVQDANTVRENAYQGIDALVQLRAEWGNLVVFFEEISTIIKRCMTNPLKTFVQTASVSQKLEGKKEMMFAFYTGIYEQTLQLSQVSYAVGKMAGAYVKIATDNLMELFTQLTRLTVLHLAENSLGVDTVRKQLKQKCKSSQIALHKKIEEQHRLYENAVDERFFKLKQELEDVMIRSENIPAIQNDVQEELKKIISTEFEKPLLNTSL